MKNRDKLKNRVEKISMNNEALERCCRYRNMVTSLKKILKFNFFRNKILECKFDVI